jgi:thiol-disulfide isomerase/thioredoxin
MGRLLSTFILMVLFSPMSYSQKNSNLEIILEYTIDNATNYPTALVDSLAAAKFKKPATLGPWIIKYFDFERNISNSSGDKKAYFFIEKLSDSTMTIILDSNHDGDFTNDKAYHSSTVKEFTKKDPILYKIDAERNVQLYLDTEGKNRKYMTPIENELPLQINFLHRAAKHYDARKETFLKFQNATRIPLLPIDLKKDHFYVDGVLHNYTDTLTMFGKNFTINQVSKYGDTLGLQLISDVVNDGFSEIQRVKAFDFTEFVTNEKMSLYHLGKEFVLVDFWGTWCGPCITGIPELKKLYEEHREIIQLLSVCSDDSKNKEKLKKIISEQKMNWLHLFDDYSLDNSITNKFHVSAFPTFILLNKEGLILSRGDANSLAKIRKILKSKVP